MAKRMSLSRSNFAWVFRVIIVLAVLTGNRLSAQDRQSLFGPSGLSFIPTAAIIPGGATAWGYSSRPATRAGVDLFPYSLRLGQTFMRGRLEVAFTNTYHYASRRKGVDVRRSLIPIIPSMKYQLVAKDSASNFTAVAFGIVAPYGVYYAYDRDLQRRRLNATVHLGIATKLTTYHAFLGATLRFGRRGPGVSLPAPFRLLLEGSWAGSLQSLDKMEESFMAATLIYQWTKQLTLETFARYDAPYGSRGPVRMMGLGIGFVGRLR